VLEWMKAKRDVVSVSVGKYEVVERFYAEKVQRRSRGFLTKSRFSSSN